MFVPVRVSVPPERVRLPFVPEITPEKVSLAAAVRVKVSPPRVTDPEPDRLLIEVPALVSEMSKVPLSATPEDWEMDAPFSSPSSAPASMVVWPV